MEMYLPLILAFAIATLTETLSPGPTLALVLESRISAGRRAALLVVAGITTANTLWVIVSILALDLVHSLFGTSLTQLVICCGTAYLMYLASERLLSAVIHIITGCSEQDDKTPPRSSPFFTGIIAHAGNPLTVSYYVSTFGLATMEKPMLIKICFGAVAILSDFIIYGLMASVTFGVNTHFLRAPFFRIAAGIALLYFITGVYSHQTPTSSGLAITSLTLLAMLGGLLFAAIRTAYGHVVRRKDMENKLLWRTVTLWSVWFTAFAAVGGFYSFVNGLDGSAMALSAGTETRLRICFVVAAVFSLALSFVKAFGEVQDAQSSNLGSSSAVTRYWQASFWRSGVVAFTLLASLFVMMSLIGFKVE